LANHRQSSDGWRIKIDGWRIKIILADKSTYNRKRVAKSEG
jgi:hypothetical protein